MLIQEASQAGISLFLLEHQRRVANWLYWWTPEEWEKSRWCFRSSAAALIAVPTGCAPEGGAKCAVDESGWIRWWAVMDGKSETKHLRSALAAAEEALRSEGIRRLWTLSVPAEWPSRSLLDALGFRRADVLITLRKTLTTPQRLPTAWHVREAHSDDVSPLLSLDTRVFDEPWRLGGADLRRLLTRSKLALVVEAEGKVVGYLCAIRQSEDDENVHIVRLAVDQAYRRRGIATSLLLEAQWRLARQGARFVSLNTMESNHAARRLYAAFGFKALRTPAWVWQKPLAP